MTTLDLNKIEHFIADNIDKDALKLRIKYCSNKSRNEAYDTDFYDFAISQIEIRNKYFKKFPSFINKNCCILFPAKITAEQASHEFVARYHAELLKRLRPRPCSLLDMSAGLGIDFMFMADSLAGNAFATAVELDSDKAKILKFNMQLLRSESQIDSKPTDRSGLSLEVLNDDSIKVLDTKLKEGKKYDVIFVDPARRDDAGGRLYDPLKCSPDVITNADKIFDIASNVFVKNSPMLDLNQAKRIFKHIRRIYVTSVKNDCKEILLHLCENGNYEGVAAVDIDGDGIPHEESFSFDDEKTGYNGNYVTKEIIESDLFDGGGYLYEPSCSIMKLGVWGALASRYNIIKMSPNCHVFYSCNYIPKFPGRCLKIKRIIDKKNRSEFKGKHINIVSRNYPEKAEQIATKLKSKPGDSHFIYGLSIESSKGNRQHETPILIEAEKSTSDRISE